MHVMIIFIFVGLNGPDGKQLVKVYHTAWLYELSYNMLSSME